MTSPTLHSPCFSAGLSGMSRLSCKPQCIPVNASASHNVFQCIRPSAVPKQTTCQSDHQLTTFDPLMSRPKPELSLEVVSCKKLNAFLSLAAMRTGLSKGKQERLACGCHTRTGQKHSLSNKVTQMSSWLPQWPAMPGHVG